MVKCSKLATRMAQMMGTIEPHCVAKGDWQSYSERLEQFILANQVERERKVATFLTVIGEEAYSLLRSW